MSLGLWSLGKSGKKSIVLEIKYLFQAVPIFSNPFGFLASHLLLSSLRKKALKNKKRKKQQVNSN